MGGVAHAGAPGLLLRRDGGVDGAFAVFPLSVAPDDTRCPGEAQEGCSDGPLASLSGDPHTRGAGQRESLRRFQATPDSVRGSSLRSPINRVTAVRCPLPSKRGLRSEAASKVLRPTCERQWVRYFLSE